jgi:membrane-associated phospholipid phosphatase
VGFQLLKPDETAWQGGILVDEDARSALALRTYGQRRAARDASDVLLASLITYPILVDGVIVANWHYQSEDVMWQMFLINAEVYAVSAALQGVVAGLTSRERPFGRTCGDELGADTRDCQSRSRYRSFYSGHSSMAFASAGLICSHHANLELYGGGAADDLTCAAGLAAAAATGALRAMGDVHYVSDVTTGALVGAGVGFGLPWLLHYRTPRARRSPRPVSYTLEPRPIVGEAWGAGVGGRF